MGALREFPPPGDKKSSVREKNRILYDRKRLKLGSRRGAQKEFPPRVDKTFKGQKRSYLDGFFEAHLFF